MLSMLGMAAMPLVKQLGGMVGPQKKGVIKPEQQGVSGNGLSNLGLASAQGSFGALNAMAMANNQRNSGQAYQGDIDLLSQGMQNLGLPDATIDVSQEGKGWHEALGAMGPLAGAAGEILGSFGHKKDRIEDPFIAKMQAERHKQANMGIQAGNNMAASAQNAAQAASRDVADQATRSGLSAGMGVDNSLVAAASGMARDTQMAGNYSQAAAQGGQLATQGQGFKGDGTRDALDRVIYDMRQEAPYQAASAVGSGLSAVPGALFEGKAYRGDMHMVPLKSYEVTSRKNREALSAGQGMMQGQLDAAKRNGINAFQAMYGYSLDSFYR